MFAEIVRIRRELFPSQMEAFDKKVLDETIKRGREIAAMLDEMFRVGKAPYSREMLLSAIFCDFGNNVYETVLGADKIEFNKDKLNEWLKYKLPMDDIDEFIGRVKEPTHYVHVVGSVNGLAADLSTSTKDSMLPNRQYL